MAKHSNQRTPKPPLTFRDIGRQVSYRSLSSGIPKQHRFGRPCFSRGSRTTGTRRDPRNTAMSRIEAAWVRGVQSILFLMNILFLAGALTTFGSRAAKATATPGLPFARWPAGRVGGRAS